jgi:catechol 2,3-dioxygenase-like lactoylglutathione lyase family enzyme
MATDKQVKAAKRNVKKAQQGDLAGRSKMGPDDSRTNLGCGSSMEAMGQIRPMTLSGVVLESTDARVLAAFYRRLLGWDAEQDEPTWVKLRSPDGGAGLSFQTDPAYARPTWPATRGEQQMMMHLDIEVGDMELAAAHAESAGAVLAEYQPQDDVRVYLDPAGHPFCLFLPE